MSRKLDVSALAAKAESGNNSSVRRIEALEIAISDLVMEEPFKSLFAIRENIKNAIRSHMQEHGYDESKPVDVWKKSSGTVLTTSLSTALPGRRPPRKPAG